MKYFLNSNRPDGSINWISLCLAVFWLAGVSIVCAQEEVQPGKTSVLLMKTGRLVSGEIGESAGGYLVKNPTGSMLVPYEDVAFEAKNLHEIYLKQRSSMKFPTANSHLNLARWCITNELFEEAKDELRDAIRLEPKRSEPQLMLRQLMSVSPTKERMTVQQKIQEKLITKKLENADEATSLTGISREQSAVFVRKIQPIMLNKCGNAKCHGNAATSKFRLTQVTRRYGNHRIYAEKNLAEVMKWIDFHQPSNSPLIVKPIQEHPQNGMVVFSGYAGRKQQQIIQDWVADAAADRLKSDTERADRLTRRANRRAGFARENLLNQAAAIRPTEDVRQADLEQSVMAQPGATADPIPRKGDVSLIADFEPKKLSDREVNELVKPKPVDPFDPALFNSAAGADQP